MKRRAFIALAALAPVTPHLTLSGEGTGSYRIFSGKIDDELAPEFSISWERDLSRATKDRRPALDFRVAQDARIYEGHLEFMDRRQPISILLVESVAEGAYLFADVDGDGRFASSEGLKFQRVTQRPNAIGDVVVWVPLAAGPFRHFPVRVRLFPNDSQPGGSSAEGKRRIFYSYSAYVTATVNVDGNPLKVWCEYHPERGVADPSDGVIGIDLNGDGELAAPPSAERAVAKNEELVFRAGTRYLSIHQVNLAARTIILLSHPPTDYIRVELRSGALFPDFEFASFQGQKCKLSEISAKYMLLDFWGSWCGPCIAEFPNLIRAYQQFRPRGLEILGIDCNEQYAKASECIAKYRLPWPQATAESTSDFVHKRLNIFSFPTLLLLDENRRIISVGNDSLKLRGESLLSTLATVLPGRP